MRRLLIWVLAAVVAGEASWYDSKSACRYNQNAACPTAAGESLYELEEASVPYCAAWDYPFGTRLTIRNRENGKRTWCIVLDRGPNRSTGRIIDLSKKVFARIADVEDGIANVDVQIERRAP